MRSHLFVSALTIALTVVTPIGCVIAFPAVAVAQSVAEQTKEADRAIEEGDRLFKEGSAESLRRAIVQFEKVLKLARLDKNQDKLSFSLLALGKIYTDLGKKKKALDYFNQSLVIRNAMGDRAGEAGILHNIGSVYDDLGEMYRALGYYNQSLLLWRIVGSQSGEATTLNNIGGIYYDLGEHKKSLDYFNQSLPLRRAVEDKTGEAGTLNNIGMIYYDLGEYNKSLDYFNQSLMLWRMVSNRAGEASTLNNIGLIYRLSKKQKALDYFNQSLSLRRTVGDRAGEARTLNNIGSIYDDLDQKSKALNCYNQSLLLSRIVNDRLGEAISLSNIAFVIDSQKQPELAIAFYKQSVNVRETIRQDIAKLPRESQESYTKSVADTYRSLANLLIQQRRLPEAQAVLELLKLRELRDFTRDTRAIDSPGISLANIEKNALTEILKSFRTIGNFSQQLSECEKTNCSTLTQLETQRDNLNKAINQELKTQRKLLADHYATESATLTPEALNKEARRIVNAQDGTVLIYPLILKDKIQFLLAFKSNQGGVTFRPFETNITAETLTTTITQFRNQLENPGDINTLKATSQTLYNTLIKPLEPELKAANIKHLVFAPDSTIRYIPLAALHDGKQYLIQRYTISTITAASQTDTTEKSPRPIAGQNQLLAMGASTFPNTKFSSLLNVPIELDSITATNQPGNSGIYPGTEVLDRAFNFDSIKTNLKTGTYKILHLATHGAFIPGNVEQSYIIPGSGPNLTSDLIDALANTAGFSNLHLVVLSACQTGVGDRASDGIEIPGISHFFLKNNVKSVLASLWNVSDASTALLMQKFYTYLAQGKTKAKALQQVQTEFLDSKLTTQDLPRAGVRLYRLGQLPPDSLAHPYFWAPFILIGNSL